MPLLPAPPFRFAHRWRRLAPLVAAALLSGAAPTAAQVEFPRRQPVPRMQVLPEPSDQASFQFDGRELTRLHFSPQLRRPFLYPAIGPSGRSLTRMGHPHDPQSHSHHNSIWVSHHDVGGVDFWGDGGPGRIVFRRVAEYVDDGAASSAVLENEWRDGAERVLLRERRRVEVRSGEGGEWFAWLDLELTPAGEEIVLGKTPFGLVGVRMAKTIGVHDGGGAIRNSEGGRDEAGCLWRRARWVDYSGPIADDALEGITLCDYPANPNHPTFFHVRDDGWMGASLTYEAPLTIRREAPLRLRYLLWIHAGAPAAEEIDRRLQPLLEAPAPE